MNPKYILAKKALESARDTKFFAGIELKTSLSELKENSPGRFYTLIAEHVLNEYQKFEPTRTENCLQDAMKAAQGDSIHDRSSVDFFVDQARTHSNTPLNDFRLQTIELIYKFAEPNRLKNCLSMVKINAASDDPFCKTHMDYWFTEAQKHSDVTLSRKAFDELYLQNEPKRIKKCLNYAFFSADNHWLDKAKDHCHSFGDKLYVTFNSFSIKAYNKIR